MMSLVSLALTFAVSQAAAAEASPVGWWINPNGTAVVEISQCGVELYCGDVRWASGKAIADAARGGTRRLIGTRVFHDFEAAGQGRWKGRIFIPDRNETSSAELRQTRPNGIRVSGCLVGRVLCKSQTWTRTEPR